MPIVLQEPASAPSRDQLLRGSPHTGFVRARRLARMKSLQLQGVFQMFRPVGALVASYASADQRGTIGTSRFSPFLVAALHLRQLPR